MVGTSMSLCRPRTQIGGQMCPWRRGAADATICIRMRFPWRSESRTIAEQAAGHMLAAFPDLAKERERPLASCTSRNPARAELAARTLASGRPEGFSFDGALDAARRAMHGLRAASHVGASATGAGFASEWALPAPQPCLHSGLHGPAVGIAS
jgi:hypothetical protein